MTNSIRVDALVCARVHKQAEALTVVGCSSEILSQIEDGVWHRLETIVWQHTKTRIWSRVWLLGYST